jgi:hypothetical protein
MADIRLEINSALIDAAVQLTLGSAGGKLPEDVAAAYQVIYKSVVEAYKGIGTNPTL